MSNCDHSWYIDPGTDGLQQVCRFCLDFRVTPMEDRHWLKPEKNIRPITPSGRFKWQWLRNGVPIEGATKSTYVIQAADLGCTINRTADYISERRWKEDADCRLNYGGRANESD